MQFRITTCDGSSEWMNCKDWSIDAMEAMADDLNMFYPNAWQRLDALTNEKKQLKLENMKLQLKSKSKLTPKDALNFLHSMIELDNNTQ